MLRLGVAVFALLSQGGVIGIPGVGIGPTMNGRDPAVAVTAPFFDFDPAPQPVKDVLSPGITVNGTDMIPSFRAYANGAGAWTITHGNVLNFNLTGSSADAPSPTDASAVQYSGTSYHRVDTTGTADVTTEDFVVEVYARNTSSVTSQFSHYGTKGWGVIYTGSQVAIRINDGVTFKQAVATSAPDTWVHAMFFVDRSGNAYAISNGIIGAALDVSTVGSITSPDKLTVGASAIGTQLHDRPIAFVSMWKCSACLDNSATTDIVSVARGRLYGLAGVAAGDVGSVTFVRPSIGVLARGNNLFSVGHGWPRVGHNAAGNNAYVAERTRENISFRSNDITDNTVWLQGAGTPYYVTTGGSVTDPWGDTSTTVGLLSDNTKVAVNHVTEQLIATTAVVSTFSAYLKAGDQYGILLYDNTTSDGVYFNATTGAAGTTLGTGVEDVFTETIGNGWFRVGFSWTPTATTQFMRIYLAPADNVVNFVGTSAVGAYVTGIQLEQNDQPSSPIKTADTEITRTNDSLWYATPAVNEAQITVDSVAQIMYAATTDAAIVACVVQLTDSGQAEYFYTRALASPTYTDKTQFFGWSGGGTQWGMVPAVQYLTGLDINDRLVVAFNDIRGYRAGGLIATDNGATVPTGMTEIYVGTQKSSPDVGSFMGYVSRVRIWNKEVLP